MEREEEGKQNRHCRVSAYTQGDTERPELFLESN